MTGPYRQSAKREVGDIDWPPSGRHSTDVHKPRTDPELIAFPLFALGTLFYLFSVMSWPLRIFVGFIILAGLINEFSNANKSRSIKR